LRILCVRIVGVPGVVDMQIIAPAALSNQSPVPKLRTVDPVPIAKENKNELQLIRIFDPLGEYCSSESTLTI